MKKFLVRYRLWALLLVLFTGFVAFRSPSKRYFEIAKNLEIFSAVFSEVNRTYVDEVDPNRLMKVGIEAMLQELDPYTNYIPEDKIEDFRFISTGQYGGIGSVIGDREGKIVVLMPYEGFPADKAGLKIGDELVQIDGINVEGKTTSDISSLLKGEAGTTVDVKVRRYGQQDLMPFTLTREKITVNNVPYYGMVSDEVGYFRLTTFTDNASKNIQDALENLKKMGAKKVVFDLRGNGGGLLREAIDISNLFIPKGSEVVSTKGKIEKANATHYANRSPFDTEIPMAILTDAHSASASEIVSGVLQDYDRAVLIGNKTYGKGLVQATFGTVYNSQLKVTTAKYYIPSGRCIQAIDYSKRDKDGNVMRTPDSLLVPFKTANGRVVYDGEGITPDIQVNDESASAVLSALSAEHLLFDYATKYFYEHKEISPAREFTLTDQEFEAFLVWVDAQGFEYQVGAEKELEEFEKALADDSLSVDLKAELAVIHQKLNATKKGGLKEHKKEIISALNREIASRYYLQKGIIESSFSSDPDMQTALRVLGDEAEYSKVLARK